MRDPGHLVSIITCYNAKLAIVSRPPSLNMADLRVVFPTRGEQHIPDSATCSEFRSCFVVNRHFLGIHLPSCAPGLLEG